MNKKLVSACFVLSLSLVSGSAQAMKFGDLLHGAVNELHSVGGELKQLRQTVKEHIRFKKSNLNEVDLKKLREKAKNILENEVESKVGSYVIRRLESRIKKIKGFVSSEESRIIVKTLQVGIDELDKLIEDCESVIEALGKGTSLEKVADAFKMINLITNKIDALKDGAVAAGIIDKDGNTIVDKILEDVVPSTSSH